MTTPEPEQSANCNRFRGCVQRMDIPREPEPTVNEASDAVGGGGAGGEKLCRPRKRQRCRLCDGWIEIGEQCNRWSGLDPGEGYFTCHTHPECLALTEGWDWGDWECCMPGDIVRPKLADVMTRPNETALRGISKSSATKSL